MKIDIKYTGKILNLPASVAEFAPDASREELIVIIGLFSCTEYFDTFDKYIDIFAEKVGIGVERIMKALSFWADKGVISLEGELPADIAFSRIDNILTGDQIKKFVENNESIRSLFFASQKILAREFNSYDHEQIIKIKEFYRFSDNYILLLLSFCKDIEKTSWASIKSTAKYFYEEGIDTFNELQKHLANRHDKNSLEFKIRELFDIGMREFTKSEKHFFDKWIKDNIDFELIQHAYNLMISNTKNGQNSSLKYCWRTVENWLRAGINTASEVKKKFPIIKQESTYDVDDFFEAALARSYEKISATNSNIINSNNEGNGKKGDKK